MVGLNLLMRVWRINNLPDDTIGGAIHSGTMIYDGVRCRMESNKPEAVLLQQGYDVNKLFNIACQPASMWIEADDEVEIIKPTNHPYYLKRLQVRGVQNTSLHPDDSRGYLLLTVRRREYAHAP